jgi:hypothetical protein
VSYGFALAGDAIADLRALEPWLQEEVIDQMELLAADPTGLEGEDDDTVAYTFVCTDRHGLHQVSLTLARNDAARRLTLLGIRHRPL